MFYKRLNLRSLVFWHDDWKTQTGFFYDVFSHNSNPNFIQQIRVKKSQIRPRRSVPKL
jgi:hypothetical protein